METQLQKQCPIPKWAQEGAPGQCRERQPSRLLVGMGTQQLLRYLEDVWRVTELSANKVPAEAIDSEESIGLERGKPGKCLGTQCPFKSVLDVLGTGRQGE